MKSPTASSAVPLSQSIGCEYETQTITYNAPVMKNGINRTAKVVAALCLTIFIVNAWSSYNSVNRWRGPTNSGNLFHRSYHTSTAWVESYDYSECNPSSPDTRSTFSHTNSGYWFYTGTDTCGGGVEPDVDYEVKDHDSDDEFGDTSNFHNGQIDDDSTNKWD